MKYFQISILLSLLFSIHSLNAKTFNEKQADLRTQKPISIFSGINSISNYYFAPYLGISYTLNGNIEFGFLYINSEYNYNYDPKIIPAALSLSQSIYSFQEFDKAYQNSGKLFTNYYLFNSIFFVNATLGYLPAISSGSYINSVFDSQVIGPGYGYFSIEYKKMPTYYFSPGFGMKVSFENGIFFTITGGPLFLQKNRTELTLQNFRTTNTTESNLVSNVLLNLPILRNSANGLGRSMEAYVDISAGISF